MTEMTPQERIKQIKVNFQLGGHKAAAIAMVAQKTTILLLSDLPEAFVRSIGLEPCGGMEAAMERIYEICGQDAKILVMPYAGSTLPQIG